MQVLIQKEENSNKKEEKKSNCSNICRYRIFCVTTNTQENRKGTLSRQKTACRDKKWEESNNLVEIKKVYVATRFFSTMSITRRIFRDKEASIATNETGRKHKFCRDKESSVTTLIFAT